MTLTWVVLASGAAVYGLLSVLLGWNEQADLSAASAALSLVIGLVGFIPVWLMSRRSSFGSAYGFMVSIMVRCFAGFAAVLWLSYGSSIPNSQDAVMWISGWYLLVLGVEVKLVSSHILAATRSVGPMPETT
jgi:hypothetical protein